MKNSLILLLTLCVQAISAQETDVKKALQTFFEGLHTGDTLQMKAVCSNGMILQSISENSKGSKLKTENVAAFFKSIASIPAGTVIEEKLLSYTIQTDGSLAHAWTPYEFYINGKLSHKGVNSFQLFKENGVWKIVYIIDTRRK